SQFGYLHYDLGQMHLAILNHTNWFLCCLMNQDFDIRLGSPKATAPYPLCPARCSLYGLSGILQILWRLTSVDALFEGHFGIQRTRNNLFDSYPDPHSW